VDDSFMRLALEQACLAQEAGEVPVGAVIIDANGMLLASGFNRVIQDHDPTGHAEVVALRNAAKKNGNYRLPGATLFVTLEPCVMCMGAIMHARLARVVFGASDPKTGACGSVINLPLESRLNHHTQVEGGVLAHECGETLRDFFKRRRSKESQIES
jgi:tRNA(adenine34) deaminase